MERFAIYINLFIVIISLHFLYVIYHFILYVIIVCTFFSMGLKNLNKISLKHNIRQTKQPEQKNKGARVNRISRG